VVLAARSLVGSASPCQGRAGRLPAAPVSPAHAWDGAAHDRMAAWPAATQVVTRATG